jgi:hypothetical protein
VRRPVRSTCRRESARLPYVIDLVRQAASAKVVIDADHSPSSFAMPARLFSTATGARGGALADPSFSPNVKRISSAWASRATVARLAGPGGARSGWPNPYSSNNSCRSSIVPGNVHPTSASLIPSWGACVRKKLLK